MPAEARKFYELLASEAEVTASDEAERVEVDRPGDRVLDLTIRPAKGDDAAPVYHRRFDRDDTREVRLYLNGGDDVVVIRGTGGGAPLLRVVAAAADDRSRTPQRVAGLILTTRGGPTWSTDCIQCRSTRALYRDHFQLTDSTRFPARDWGGFLRFRPWYYSPAVVFGFFFGGGVVRHNFGFRKQPLASKLAFRAGYADWGPTVPRRFPRAH